MSYKLTLNYYDGSLLNTMDDVASILFRSNLGKQIKETPSEIGCPISDYLYCFIPPSHREKFENINCFIARIFYPLDDSPYLSKSEIGSINNFRIIMTDDIDANKVIARFYYAAGPTNEVDDEFFIELAIPNESK